MAKSTYHGANLDIVTDTFGGLVTRTNDLIHDSATIQVTTTLAAIPNTNNGGVTVGNAHIQGTMSANVLSTPSLTGGTIEHPANLIVGSNTVMQRNVTVQGILVTQANNTLGGGFVNVTANTTIRGTNTVVLSNTTIQATNFNALVTNANINAASTRITGTNATVDVTTAVVNAATVSIKVPNGGVDANSTDLVVSHSGRVNVAASSLDISATDTDITSVSTTLTGINLTVNTATTNLGSGVLNVQSTNTNVNANNIAFTSTDTKLTAATVLVNGTTRANVTSPLTTISGGQVNVTSNTRFGGTVTVNGTTSITAPTAITGSSLSVAADTVISGRLNVTGTDVSVSTGQVSVTSTGFTNVNAESVNISANAATITAPAVIVTGNTNMVGRVTVSQQATLNGPVVATNTVTMQGATTTIRSTTANINAATINMTGGNANVTMTTLDIDSSGLTHIRAGNATAYGDVFLNAGAANLVHTSVINVRAPTINDTATATRNINGNTVNINANTLNDTVQTATQTASVSSTVVSPSINLNGTANGQVTVDATTTNIKGNSVIVYGNTVAITSPATTINGGTLSIVSPTSVTGALTVSGVTVINGTTLTVSSPTTFSGTVAINGNSTIGGSTLTVNANSIFGGSLLRVNSANAHINGTGFTATVNNVNVQSNTLTLNSPTATINTNITTFNAGTLNLNSNTATITGTSLTVNPNTVINGQLAAYGPVTIGGASLSVSAPTVINNSVTTNGSMTVTGLTSVTGNTVINGNLTHLNSDVTNITSALNVTGPTAVTGTLDVTGDTSVNGNVIIGAVSTNQVRINGRVVGNIFGSANFGNSTSRFGQMWPAVVNSVNVSANLITANTLQGNLNWSYITSKPSPNLRVNVTGGANGTANVTFTQLGNAVMDLNVTLIKQTIDLGQDTEGNFVSAIEAGEGINIFGSGNNNALVTVAHADTSGVANANIVGSGGTVINRVSATFDTFGHVTGMVVNSTNLDTRYSNLGFSKIQVGNTFANATAISDTLTLASGGNISIVPSGKTVTIGSTDTLDSVLARGATSTRAVTVGALTATSLSGSGAGITAINASNISTGTIADARLPSTAVRTSRNIATGNGLTGGGNLSADRTLSVVSGNGTVVNATGIHVGAGNGLSVNSTALAVGAGDGITVNATAVSVNNTVVRTTGDQTINGAKTFSNLESTQEIGIRAANTTHAAIGMYTDNVITWKIGRGMEDWHRAFHIFRYDANGVYLNSPLYISNTGLTHITNGSGIQNISANYIAVGTLPDARLSANIMRTNGSGAAITAINASNISTGTLADARLPSTAVRTSRQVIAGTGLSGGGNLSADRTLAVVSGNGTTVNSTGIHVGAGNGLSVNTTALAVGQGDGISVNATAVSVNNTVVRTSGDQTIGGVKTYTGRIDIDTPIGTTGQFRYDANGVPVWAISRSPNTLNLDIGRHNSANGSYLGSPLTIEHATGKVNIADGSGISAINASNITTGTLADARLPTTAARTSRNISTGNGLTGGGNLGADRTLSVVSGNGTTVNSTGIHVGAGDGVSVNATAVSVNNTVVRTTGDQTIAGVKTFTSDVVTRTHHRIVSTTTNTSMIHRFDGNNYYLLFSDTLMGTYNTLRPIQINANTGRVTIGNGLSVTTSNGTALTVSGTVIANTFSGSFSGTGASLTSLNASNLTSGTIPDGRLPTNLVKTSGNQTINGTLGVTNINVSGGGYFDSPNTQHASILMLTDGIIQWRQGRASGNGNYTLWRYSANGTYIDAPLTVSLSTGQTTITDGSGISQMNASRITMGTLADARLPSTVVKTSGNQTVGGTKTFSTTIMSSDGIDARLNLVPRAGSNNDLIELNYSLSGNFGFYNKTKSNWALRLDQAGSLFANGASLTSLNASNITSGTIPDARLSSNVIKSTGNQSITGGNFNIAANVITFGAGLNARFSMNPTQISSTVNAEVISMNYNNLGRLGFYDHGRNQWVVVYDIADGSYAMTANGSGLTSLNASRLTSGTVPYARLPTSLINTSNIQQQVSNIVSAYGTIEIVAGATHTNTYDRVQVLVVQGAAGGTTTAQLSHNGSTWLTVGTVTGTGERLQVMLPPTIRFRTTGTLPTKVSGFA